MLNNATINPFINFQNISKESFKNRPAIKKTIKKDIFEREQPISFQRVNIPSRLIQEQKGKRTVIKKFPIEEIFGDNSKAEEDAMKKIKELLQENQGIIIGDCNYLPYVKKFINRNIKRFKEDMNVRCLFYDSKNYKNALKMLLLTQENGIRTFGIELPPESSHDLLQKNKDWSVLIKKYIKELGSDEKYIVFCNSDQISSNQPGYLSSGLEVELGSELKNLPAIITHSEHPSYVSDFAELSNKEGVFGLYPGQDSCIV